MTDSLITGNDGRPRCGWCGDDPLYMRYHDEEWGRPVHDDIRLFEKICLEGFQAGLSWLTILKKRENFRDSFAGFDFEKLAGFGQNDIERLLRNEGIIRHRGKIEAAVNNAGRAIETAEEFGSLDAYFWNFSPHPASTGPPAANKSCHPPPPGRGIGKLSTNNYPPSTLADIPVKTPESEALSRDLKRRGWRFVGPTTCYAFMQAMGMVNDHIEGCFAR